MGFTGKHRPRATGRSTLVVGLCVAASLLSPGGAAAQYGTIKGRLVWGGDSVPAEVLQEKGKAAKDPNVCAKDQSILSHALQIDPQSKGVQFGFAYVVRPKGTNPDAVKDLITSKPTVEVDQKNCDFLPHSTAIHQDQTLVMKSSDPTGHNIRLSGFTNSGTNKTIAPNGRLDVKLVAERLPMTVACDIHPWMHAHLMIFDHPFFAVTGADGTFEIKGVPAGDQNVVVWQEKIGYVTPGKGSGTPVKVVDGQVTDMGDIKFDKVK
jgi:hypothetical protein